MALPGRTPAIRITRKIKGRTNVAPDTFTGIGIRVLSARVTLRGPVVRGYRIAIHATGADLLTVEDAVVHTHGPGGEHTMDCRIIRVGAGGRFQDNVVSSSGASGIEVGASADPVIAGNKIEAAEQAGIFVYDLGRGRFRDNEVLSSGYSGLVIAAGGAPVFVGNLVRDNAEHGILAIDGSSGIVEDNRVLDNKGHGIALAKGTDVELGGNTLEGNKEPQVLEGWLVGF